jgi:riboflavin biosynthesis pyrimidine reductase
LIRQLIPESSGPLTDADVEARYALPGSPGVTANFVISLDGVVEVGGRSGPLGSPADKAVFMALRAVNDVVLVGSGTVRAENYGPVVLGADQQARRRDRGQASLPVMAILSDSADLDPAAKVFRPPAGATVGQAVLVVTSDAAPAERVRALEAVADVVVAGEQRVDPVDAVGVLSGRGFARVLCEGGPTVFGRCVEAGVIDELCLTLSPTLAGPGHMSFTGRDAHPPYGVRLHELYEGDGLLMTRYRRPVR